MKAKITLSLLVATAMLLTITGCTSAGVHSPTGFSTVIGPAVFSSVTYPSYIQPTTLTGREYQVLGNVEGTSSAKSIFFMFAVGDGGINTAITNALSRAPQADDIIDLKVDTDVFNFLWMYISSTTHVHGKAIKYLDNGIIKRKQ